MQQRYLVSKGSQKFQRKERYTFLVWLFYIPLQIQKRGVLNFGSNLLTQNVTIRRHQDDVCFAINHELISVMT